MISLIMGLFFVSGGVHSMCIRHLLYGMKFANETEGAEVEKSVHCASVSLGIKLQDILNDIDNTTQVELASVTSETEKAVSVLIYYAQLLQERNTTDSINGIKYMKNASEGILEVAEELLDKANSTTTSNNQTLLDNIVINVTQVIAKLKYIIKSLSEYL